MKRLEKTIHIESLPFVPYPKNSTFLTLHNLLMPKPAKDGKDRLFLFRSQRPLFGMPRLSSTSPDFALRL